MEQSTICLTMIVKNEAHLIEDTLNHLLKYITFSYWVICDTGSTDDTRKIIQRFFDSRSIPGELVDSPWRDFAYNRTVAFEHAYKKADYAFVWDADDEISGDFVMPKVLTGDWYKFTFGTGNSFRYSRCQLFKNDKKWKYVGVLHEYPACCEHADSPIEVNGNYHFISGRRGDRSKNPNKYVNDATVLEKAFHEAVEAKDPIHCRYAFYCAQSYNSANMLEKAIEYYKKTLTLDNWAQEKYVSCIEIFELYERLGTPELAIPYLIDSFNYDSTRVECYYRLIKYYCINKLPQVSYGFYSCIQNYFETEYLHQNIADKLFAKKSEYDFYLPYYVIIVADRLKKYELTTFCYTIIFQQKFVPPTWWLNNLIHNIQFCINALPKTITFLESMLEYLHLIKREGHTLEAGNYKVVENVVNAYRHLLTVTPKSLPSPSKKKNINVMMSFTTCKRLDLFKQTMNSIINTWKDLHLVDMFYCVDDNSSEEDRELMKSMYPFFTFYFKNPEEKGHRQSMNIIWNTLQDVKPKYWIHLEDDWLYFHPRNYISNSIEYLERFKEKDVHQIVFNKNYGLFYSDMERVGGISLTPDLVLHEKRDGLVGKNCGYWPHYSLQPSISRTEIILSLGNYDSANSFFERDYANKYFSRGFKTAFFPAIYSIHIGKQHWEKDGKNAYALNETSQFNRPDTAVFVPPVKVTTGPLQGTMNQHLDTILSKLNALQPFALIRPSDGEYTILKGKSLTNCDSWTFTEGGILQSQLAEAIKTVNPSLYIGIPCNTCNKGWNCTHEIYNDFLSWGVPLGQKTYANLFMNSNWKKFVGFMKSFKHGFSLVSSGTLTGTLPIQDRLVIDSKLLDNWDKLHEEETARVLDFVKDKVKKVVCFSAGPLSKVWIPLCYSKYPENIYLDIGSSLDHITKGSESRPYMMDGHPFQTEECLFDTAPAKRNENLLYMCVFFNKDYIRLLHILLTSMKVYSNINFDILIVTQTSFYQDIVRLGYTLNIPLYVHCVPDRKTVFEAACARLHIFEYPAIDEYKKIFYIDTDIILKKDISVMFDLAVDDLIYVIPEATISNMNFGKQFFDFTKISGDTPGINSGTLLFNNTPAVKGVFNKIITHIKSHVAEGLPAPLCMDQPFISYNMINESMYDNVSMKPFIGLYEEPDTVVNYNTSVICHFTFPIGNFNHKFHRMKNFFVDLLKKEKPPVSSECICGWREGFCTECTSVTQDKKYVLDWHTNTVTLYNGVVYTPWGSGTSIYLHTCCFQATWSGHSHLVYLFKDTFLSIRVQPQDFDIVRGTYS